MSKPTAVNGDVKATASSTKATEDTDSKGSWSAGTVSYNAYSYLTINGKQVIYEASCTFTYTGASANNSSVTVASDLVTLSANATLLQKGANQVLVDGDQVTSNRGNKLQVQASNIISTA